MTGMRSLALVSQICVDELKSLYNITTSMMFIGYRTVYNNFDYCIERELMMIPVRLKMPCIQAATLGIALMR
jgi:hypothetical protein